MASRSERRAALSRLVSPSRDVESVLLAGTPVPTDEPINPSDYLFLPDDGEPMKIQFQSVYLDESIPRLPGGNKGLAASETSFFDVSKTPGISIELDCASGLVCLSNDQGRCFVPREKVKRFGDVLSPPKP